MGAPAPPPPSSSHLIEIPRNPAVIHASLDPTSHPHKSTNDPNTPLLNLPVAYSLYALEGIDVSWLDGYDSRVVWGVEGDTEGRRCGGGYVVKSKGVVEEERGLWGLRGGQR